jgi:hypothetical protein
VPGVDPGTPTCLSDREFESIAYPTVADTRSSSTNAITPAAIRPRRDGFGGASAVAGAVGKPYPLMIGDDSGAHGSAPRPALVGPQRFVSPVQVEPVQ